MSSRDIKRICTRSAAPRDLINVNKVKVVIGEQPIGKVRYRRAQEKSAPVLGEYSRPEKKSYPSVRVLNSRGPALVLVSLVTRDAPYYPHPNRLVRLRGSDSKCQNGVYLGEISGSSGDQENDAMKMVLKNLAIQRVEERDAPAELELRKKAKVDPFQTGYEHDTSRIDLGCARMCFQVFLKNKVTQKFDVMLDPVVSEPIWDTSADNDISIQFASHTSDSVKGGTEMCVLCKKASRDDIKVVFFDDESDWRSEARLLSPGVWNRVALLFKVPTYSDQGIERPVRVSLQLVRPSDGAVSRAWPFTYEPAAPPASGRKRKREEPVFEETTDDLERLAEEDANLITIVDESIMNIEPWRLPERSLLSMRYSSCNYELSKSQGKCQTDLPEIRHDNIDEELAKLENVYNDDNSSDVDKFVCHQNFAPYTPESLEDDDAENKNPDSPDSTELLDERRSSKRKHKNHHPSKDAAGLNQIGRNLLDIDPNWLG